MARTVFGISMMSAVFIDPPSWVYLGLLLWGTGLSGRRPLLLIFSLSPGGSCK